MIKIGSEKIKHQENFWSHCLFHPTDAVEDPWGKRILDRMARDKAIKTIRLYAMLEDIVYMDEDGNLCYDYRINDLRLDYLVEKGYDILLAYAAVPDCIAADTRFKSKNAFKATRYKGKMWNTSQPADYGLWEEVCYQYTKHLVERYGIERVAGWHIHCYNEPDIKAFFLSQYENSQDRQRIDEYCKMYEAFTKGVLRVSDKLTIGGPALARKTDFLDGFLAFVKEKGLRLDYIALHNYGTYPKYLKDGSARLTVQNNMDKHAGYMEVIRKHGFGDTEILVDEWGAATKGFANREECPELMFRETEVFSAYYGKLVSAFIDSEYEISKMIICLSGQHEMTEDFTGFRNFFTLNFIAKPIYNAHLLGSWMGDALVEGSADDPNLAVLPTKTENGYAVMLTYASEFFEEDIPALEETLSFREDVTGKTATVWAIDKDNTNPYRLFEKMGSPVEPSREQIELLRAEGQLKPVAQYTLTGNQTQPVTMTPNGLYLITVE